MKEFKKIVFPGIPLVLLGLLPFLFGLGLLIGFCGTEHFCQKLVKTGKVRAVFLHFGQRKIHCHHWLMAALFLLFLWGIDIISFFPKFFLGGAVGVLCHDLLTDKHWYRILVRKVS